ncbi:alpha/beta fold hydrolase [Sphingomonas sp. ac-8]|uniref:alpha/beta fold hydrolase n=1 Tax=Sphingomonas sp. ac-8 TaxID=3242977 RepID=UPI003A809FDC
MAAHALYRRAIPAAARITRWHAPDGWAHRRFDWPAAPGRRQRGAMLFQVGRGDVFEKYLESFAHWRARGWSITSFDWRGQGGSGRLTDDPHCGHIESFDAYVDDLAAFVAEWRAENAGPHVLVGHSMGGHLVLRGLAEGRVAADAAVLVAPMLGLKAPIGPRFGERAARLLAALGRPTRRAWGSNERPFTRAARQSLLTGDRERYEDELWWLGANPDTRTGPPSWRWVVDAFRSTRELAESPALARLSVPVQLLVAERDALVDPRAALAVAERLGRATLVRFGPEARHELLRETDAVRDRAIHAIDTFLDDALA